MTLQANNETIISFPKSPLDCLVPITLLQRERKGGEREKCLILMRWSICDRSFPFRITFSYDDTVLLVCLPLKSASVAVVIECTHPVISHLSISTSDFEDVHRSTRCRRSIFMVIFSSFGVIIIFVVVVVIINSRPHSEFPLLYLQYYMYYYYHGSIYCLYCLCAITFIASRKAGWE